MVAFGSFSPTDPRIVKFMCEFPAKSGPLARLLRDFSAIFALSGSLEGVRAEGEIFGHGRCGTQLPILRHYSG